MFADFAVCETPHARGQAAICSLLFGDNEAISYSAHTTEVEAPRLQTTFTNAIRELLLYDVLVAAEKAKRLVSLKSTG
jgi:hypothetical protein